MRGLVARFRELDAMVDAAKELRRQGFVHLTLYSPTPRHELEDALGHPKSNVRLYTLIGGLLGVTFGYWIAIWASEWWPLVVGGKPIPSWVPYTIFGFEVMVLIGGLSTVAGLFISSRLPKIGTVAGYDGRFSHGDYGIYIEAGAEHHARIEQILRAHGPAEVRGER